MSNKIGFNNFKAFGPKMQYFSNKPITLVFGPNSVGKSSFLHSQLYYEYLKKLIFPQRNDFSAINLISSHFAGDNLDLGGIKNFIHKHLENEEIVYEEVYTDIDEIGNFFPKSFQNILNLSKKGVFDYSSEILESVDDFYELIYSRVSIYEIKEGEYYVPISLKNYNGESLGIEEEILYENFIKEYSFENTEKSKEIFIANLNNNKSLSSIIKRADEKELDLLDLYILFILDLFPKYFNKFNKEEFLQLLASTNDQLVVKQMFFKKLKFYKYLASITKLTITNVIQKDNNLVTTILINDEKVFRSKYPIEYLKSLSTEFLANGSSKFINLFFVQENYMDDNIEQMINEKVISFNVDYFTPNVDFIYRSLFWKFKKTSIEHFNGIIYSLIKPDISNLQYFGPLRFWPERYEHFDKSLDVFDNKKYIDKFPNEFNESKIVQFIAKVKPKIIGKVLFFIFIIFNKEYQQFLFFKLREIFNSPFSNDTFNYFRKNKKSLKGSYSSSKMWENLCNSEEIQNKINYWLENDKKLKTPYNISVEKKLIKVNVLKKIFRFKDRIQFGIKFLDKNKNTEVTSKDIGLGISQMLPLLISSISSKNTRHYIEQPELHLHPAIQMELMDEFIKSKNENKNQFMMESHSEHMLLRIMKRIKQTQNDTLEDESLRLTPEDVCLLYVDNDGEQTYIQELRLSKNGKLLDHWPNGFFEEGYKERFF